MDLVAIEDVSEVQLLRLHLEALGCETVLVRCGRPSDVFAGLARLAGDVEAVILSGHGDESGFIFPEMALGIDAFALPDNRITPGVLFDRLRQAPATVVSTACGTGTEAFASAFFSAGTETYVAPSGDPDGRDIAVFVALLAHAIMRRGLAWEPALAAANAAVEAGSCFRLWTAPAFV